MRQRTASSMNFERSPFFIPWAPKKDRNARSACLDHVIVKRVVSSCSGMANPSSYKQMSAYMYNSSPISRQNGQNKRLQNSQLSLKFKKLKNREPFCLHFAHY